MTNSEAFTNSKALGKRAGLNTRLAKYNLEDWVYDNAFIENATSVLDIGCGQGKQTLYFARRLPKTATIVGLDISTESIDIVNQMAKQQNYASIETIVADIDDSPHACEGRQFDRIVSTYAFYYSKDQAGLLKSLRNLLNDKGIIYISGPDAGSNEELIALANQHVTGDEEPVPDFGVFISAAAIEDVAAHYSSCESIRLANKIEFQTPEEVLVWWRNHPSWKPALETRVKADLEKHFETNRTFLLSKNVLGYRFEK